MELSCPPLTAMGGLVVNVHGDGGSFGRPQPRAADRSNRTILSTMTTNDNPTALAAMMQLVEDLAVDASFAPDSENPFRQVIVNTHSRRGPAVRRERPGLRANSSG